MYPKILTAVGAYGRKARMEDWRDGKDFKLACGGPYFSIRDIEQMKAAGVEKIHFEAVGGLVFVVDFLNDSTVVYR